jgi:hypothetical protein
VVISGHLPDRSFRAISTKISPGLVHASASRRTSSLYSAENFRRAAFAMTSTPKGFKDVTAMPRDDHLSQSFLALLSKLQGKECFTHVDTRKHAFSRRKGPRG